MCKVQSNVQDDQKYKHPSQFCLLGLLLYCSFSVATQKEHDVQQSATNT